MTPYPYTYTKTLYVARDKQWTLYRRAPDGTCFNSDLGNLTGGSCPTWFDALHHHSTRLFAILEYSWYWM